jgi:hypothetical protein
VQALLGMKGIEFELANRMVENVITTISIPVGVATNVIVDGVERLWVHTRVYHLARLSRSAQPMMPPPTGTHYTISDATTSTIIITMDVSKYYCFHQLRQYQQQQQQ